MASYTSLLNEARQRLHAASDTPQIDAEHLLLHTIDNSLSWLIAYGEQQASAKHERQFIDLIKRRAKGEPIAYILGYRDFWSLRLAVNEHVLIPRPDTEILVEHALQQIPEHQACRILDLGTGSGAIALSIAKERPMSQVLATDNSPKALAVAQANAKQNDISNVEFLQSNWFDNINKKKFDVIVSNPPYVEKNDPHLSTGDLRFEPINALTTGDTGFASIAEIIRAADDFLTAQGWLFIEHGFEQQDQVCALFRENDFENIKGFDDLNKLPRCVSGQIIIA